MNKWKVNWSGAIQSFPGLEHLITDFDRLTDEAKQQVAHIEQSVLAYFAQHQGTNGSLAIDAQAIENGEHSATVTLAAIPKVREIPPEGERIPEPPIESEKTEQEPEAPDSDRFVVQGVGNGLSLVFGPTSGETWSTREDAQAGAAALAATTGTRVGEHPQTHVVEITKEQLASLTIEGLPE